MENNQYPNNQIPNTQPQTQQPFQQPVQQQAPQQVPPQYQQPYPQQMSPQFQQSYPNPPTNPKKPVYKKWWFWVIIVIAVLFVFSAVFGNDDSGTTNEQTTTSPSYEITTKEETTEETTEATTVTTTEPTTVESPEEYIASCEYIDYKELARNPDQYKGKRIAVQIEIAQEMTGGFLSAAGYRGYEDYDIYSGSYLDREWFINYSVPEGSPRILEKDIVIFYGEYVGTLKMERALTNTTVYVPSLNAVYYEIQE